MKNHRFSASLPSKKFCIRLFVLLAVVGFFWLFEKKIVVIGRNDNQEKNNLPAVLQNNGGLVDKLKNYYNSDDDDDGLKNWEEALWKTDPKKEDTDNDGYPDKEETDGGYDPLDSESNPKTQKKRTSPTPSFLLDEGSSVNPETALEGNLTKMAASSLSYNLMKNQGKGPPPADSAVSDVLTKTAEKYLSSLNTAISKDELKISEDNGKPALEEYVRAVAAALQKNSVEINTDLSEITTGDFANIDKLIRSSEAAAAALKKIETPSVFADIHKKHIEMLLTAAKVFREMKLIQTDSMRAILAMTRYNELQNEYASWAEEVYQIAVKHNLADF